MNAKTAKLIHKIALASGTNEKGLKAKWYGASQRERHRMRRGMRHVLLLGDHYFYAAAGGLLKGVQRG